MKDAPRQQFRWAPHSSGVTQVKPRDYEQAAEAEGSTFYGAWSALKDTGMALQIGDLLEREDGELRIYKYVGFDEAHWILPEVKPSGLENTPITAGQPA